MEVSIWSPKGVMKLKISGGNKFMQIAGLVKTSWDIEGSSH